MTHRPDTMTHGSAHKAYVDAISKIAGDTRESLGALIRHGGEKGALAETIASDFLKKVLPKRYSIGSGFIVTHSGGESVGPCRVIGGGYELKRCLRCQLLLRIHLNAWAIW